MGTHNRLLGLGPGAYLEAIAVDPGAAGPGRPRWFGLDTRRGPARLTHWVVRTEDIEAACRRLPHPAQVEDHARGDLRWRMALPPDGRLPWAGLFPGLIEWCDAPPVIADSGLRLSRLVLSHPEAGELRDAVTGLCDDPRLEFVTGAAGLRAELDGPGGRRTIE